MSNFAPFRGAPRRGRGRRRGSGPPKPRFEELQAALHAEFPADSSIVEEVLKTNRNTPLESLRRLVRDQKYAYVPVQRYEFADLREEYRDYLERFRVSFCPGNCVGKECLYFHKGLDEAIRRKPTRLENGVWRYLPIRCLEEGCTDDICAFAHSQSELLYHPIVYKTRPCDYQLTPNSTCKKYGYHCPFIHEELDGDTLLGFPYNRDKPDEPLPPCGTVEAQQDYNERMRHFSDTYVTLTDQRKNRIAELLPEEEKNNDAAFARETYKVRPCTLPSCKRDDKCLNYHSTLERRRESDTTYSQQPCGYVYDENTKVFSDSSNCPMGDSCEYAHTENEVFFHRAIYQRKPCLNFLQLSSCSHPYCPFQHERHSSIKLPVPPAPVQVTVRSEERKGQQPDISSTLAAKIEEVKRNCEHLKTLVAAAEAKLQILEAASKCSVCRKNDHLYVISCGHTMCGGCAEDGLKAKMHFCKKCNRPAKGIFRFAE